MWYEASTLRKIYLPTTYASPCNFPRILLLRPRSKHPFKQLGIGLCQCSTTFKVFPFSIFTFFSFFPYLWDFSPCFFFVWWVNEKPIGHRRSVGVDAEHRFGAQPQSHRFKHHRMIEFLHGCFDSFGPKMPQGKGDSQWTTPKPRNTVYRRKARDVQRGRKRFIRVYT